MNDLELDAETRRAILDGLTAVEISEELGVPRWFVYEMRKKMRNEGVDLPDVRRETRRTSKLSPTSRMILEGRSVAEIVAATGLSKKSVCYRRWKLAKSGRDVPNYNGNSSASNFESRFSVGLQQRAWRCPTCGATILTRECLACWLADRERGAFDEEEFAVTRTDIDAVIRG